MERESIEEFFRKLGKALEDLGKALDEIYEMICSVAEELAEETEEPTAPPHHTSDFTCICWGFLRLDLLPWYTSGFK